MNRLTSLLTKLVSINSINPDLVPGAVGENEVARFIAGWLEEAGLEVQIEEVAPNRPNVIAIARGTGGGQSLMLNGHIDTVGVAGMDAPFQPRVEAGRLYGRGAYDMKCGVAACMLTMAEIASQQKNGNRLRGDVIFTAVIDEEYAGLGTMAVAQRYHADAALIAEPTELEVIVAHKGFVWLEIETIGVAAHGSRPDLGVDAIVKMGRVLVELEQLDRSLRAHPTHPMLQSGSLHASLITGGQELSSYPARCVVSVERRTIPGETPASVAAEIQAILDRIAQDDPTFKATIRLGVDRTPMSTPVEAEIVQTLLRAATPILQRTPPTAHVSYWTDAATLTAAGIPSILFGAIGTGAHAVEEWVDLQSVEQCVQIYLAVVNQFCR